MHNTDNWSDQNTTALIHGISGIAGNLINKNKQGQPLTSQEQQVAYLAQQTAAALGQAQYQTPTPTPVMSNTTVMVIGGILLIVIGFVLFKIK